MARMISSNEKKGGEHKKNVQNFRNNVQKLVTVLDGAVKTNIMLNL